MYRLLNMLLIVIITKYTILYYNPDINDTVSHVSHGMKTLTVAFTTTLHIKQDFIAGAQFLLPFYIWSLVIYCFWYLQIFWQF
jgi:hypothetical protein